MFGLVMFLCLRADPCDAMVARLGHDDFDQRLNAEEVLAGQGMTAEAAIRRGKASTDPEVARRCKHLHAALADAWIDTLRDKNGQLPEIDAAWFVPEGRCYDTGREPYHRLVGYLDAVGRDNFPWRNYRLATHHWLLDAFARGDNLHLLRLQVRDMRRRDEVFLSIYHDVPEMETVPP